MPNSVEIWQEFRDEYSKSVIFGKTPGRRGARPPPPTKIDELAGQS